TATRFGKNDEGDSGIGSSALGLIQTCSEVFGGSIKKSKMIENFGPGWATDHRILGALIEVHSAKTKCLVRVPLVDVGPGENAASDAEVDMTFACDQVLGMHGKDSISYRLLIPIT